LDKGGGVQKKRHLSQEKQLKRERFVYGVPVMMTKDRQEVGGTDETTQWKTNTYTGLHDCRNPRKKKERLEGRKKG